RPTRTGRGRRAWTGLDRKGAISPPLCRLPPSLDYVQVAPDFAEDLQRLFDVVGAMRGTVHHADARLALRHGGVTNRHGKNALLEKLAAELLGQGRLAEHDRHNGRLAVAGVEAHLLHALAEHVGVGPEPVHEVGRFLQDVHGLDAGGDVGRRHGAGEEEGTPALPQPFDDHLLARNHAPYDAKGLAQRADFDVYTAVQAKMIDNAAPAF